MSVAPLTSAEWPYLAGAGGAGLVALATLVRTFRDRRGLKRRLGSLVLRLSEPGNQPERNLESLLSQLERSADHVLERAGDADEAVSRLAGALDGLEAAVVISNETGRVVFRNVRAAAMLSGGAEGDVLVGRAVVEALAQVSESNPVERSVELFGPPRRRVAVRAVTLDDGQRPLGAAATVSDVTHLHRLEESGRALVANASDRLLGPAAALKSVADVLAAERSPEVAGRLAPHVAAHADRIAEAVRDLVELGRADVEASPARESVSVAAVVDDAVRLAGDLAAARGVEVRVEPVRRELYVVADRRQVVAALFNLIENGVKWSEAGQAVRLRTAPVGDDVEIVVQDDGVGIAGADTARVFERFYRAGRHDDTRAGAGLGLAIVRQVADNHGGTVTLHSREGEGSTFLLRLPLSAESRAASGALRAVPYGTGAAAADAGADADTGELRAADVVPAPEEPYLSGPPESGRRAARLRAGA